MAVAASPTVRRRRLAAELRDIRQARGVSGDIVASALDWSPAKISRYELARTGLKPEDVERLLDYYQVTGQRRARLLALAQDATQKGWWEEYSDSVAPGLLQFIGLEQEASSIATWQGEIAPGLLQTESYARHVIGAYSQLEPTPPGIVERRVRVRMERQQVIARDPRPELTFVLDESMLYRRIGDARLMHDQLMHLAEESGRPNVTLRVLPLSAEHALFGPSYVIFHFGPGSDAMLHDVVSTEGLQHDFYVEGETDTYLHGLAFEILLGASLSPEESRDLIIEAAQSRWQGAG
jgi:transcriptional regulator with XRE-family HTH domain